MGIKAQQIIRTERLGGGAPGAFIPKGVIERRGLQAVTQATGALAKGLFEFGQQVQTSVRRDMVSHQYALAQKDVADSELNMKADPDHRSVPEKFSRSLTDIRAKHSSEIFDPVARNMFQQKFLGYATTREIQMKYNVWDREIDAQTAHLTETLDTKLDLINNLPLEDGITRTLYSEEAFDAINEKLASNIITEQDAVKLREAFRNEAANLKARQHVLIDPQGAAETLGREDYQRFYPGLDAGKRLSLFEKAQATVIRNQKAEVHLQEEIERIAVKEEKKRQTANYGKAVVLYSQGELTTSFIEEGVEERDIDPEKGFKLINRLRTDARQGKPQTNDVIAVGELAVKVARGQNVTEELNELVADGKIMDGTYLSMVTKVGNLDVQTAIGFINKAMAPTEFETDPNIKRTHADAIDLFWERVGADEDPMSAARDIVRRRRKTLPVPIGRPLYLTGEITSVKDFEEAGRLTAEAFQRGEIGPVEAGQEATLIERYLLFLKDDKNLEFVVDQMNKEIK